MNGSGTGGAAKKEASAVSARNARDDASGSLFARARPLMIARAASAGLSFSIPLVLARTFAPSEYGTYKQLFLISQVLYHVLPMGMAQSLYYFLPRLDVRRPYLLQTLLFLLGAGALALAGILGLRGSLAGWVNNAEVAAYAPELGVYALGIVASFPLEIVLTARNQTGQAALAYILSDLVKAAAMTLPALMGFGLRGVMVGVAGFALLRLVATWGLLLRGEAGPAFDHRAFKAQLAYALPFGAAVCMAVPQTYFHQFVVSSRLDAASFAVYAVGIFQLPIIDLLYTPTSEVLMVRLAELERASRLREGVAAFREAVDKLGWFFLPLTVFFVVAAPEFITALFTERYLGAVPVFRLVAMGILLAMLPVDGALRARNETRFIFVTYAVKVAVTIPAVLLGVGWFGMLGAVGSWLLADFVGKAMLMARLPAVLCCRMGELIPWAALGRVAGAAVIASGGILLARATVGGLGRPALTVAVGAALYGLVYVGVGLTLFGTPLPMALPGRRTQRVP